MSTQKRKEYPITPNDRHDNNNDLPFLERSLMTLFLCERESEEKIKGKEP